MHSFGALGVALTAAAIALSFAPSADLGTDYIVVLGYEPAAGGRGVDAFVREAHAELAVRATHRFTSALSGFSARLTERQRFRIASDPRVLAIVPDERIQLVDESLSSLPPPPMPATSAVPSPTTTPAPTQRPPLPTPGPDSQIVPTGVAQIGRPSLATAPLDGSDRRVDIDLAVIDTGVSRHADLNVVGGRDCTGSGTWKDGHGHGTHVAGSAAALDNGFGVVGVAPGARIWSVKILDADGVGRASWLLCGIEWVIRQRDPDDSTKPLIEVANLSARFRAATSPTDDGNCGRTKRDVVHQAVCRLIAAGTTFVVAAGNDTQNAGRYRPGGYSEVITVSALSDFDGVAGGLGLHSDSCPRATLAKPMIGSFAPATMGGSLTSWPRVNASGPRIAMAGTGRCLARAWHPRMSLVRLPSIAKSIPKCRLLRSGMRYEPAVPMIGFSTPIAMISTSPCLTSHACASIWPLHRVRAASGQDAFVRG